MADSTNAIDWELCVQLAGGNAEIAKSILDLFLETLPADVENIQKIYAEQDWQQLIAAVHKLHGATCYLGVPELKQATKSFEMILKQEQQAAIADAYTKFETAAQAVLAEKQKFV